ncbi:hypothetical protein YC2023_075029 [Brassica napus]
MPNNRRIPAITINQMKFYAHCSTSTTPSTGLGHDLMSISRNAPCSLKHIDTSGSLLPFRQDSAPSVSLSWVPLKPELILNPGWREFLLERTEVFDMRFNPLGRRSNAGRVVLRVPLVPQVPETGPFLPTLFLSEMKAESVSMDSSDPSLDLTAEVEDPKAIVSLNVSPVAEGNRYPPIGPPSVIGVEEVADWRMKYNLPVDVIIRVPGPEDRVSDFGVDEVHVYEGYFESGFRDRVPSLVAKISETL